LRQHGVLRMMVTPVALQPFATARTVFSRGDAMNFQGHVERGVVIFDEPVSLPDGTEVRVEPVVPMPGNFWQSLSLDELARRQGVGFPQQDEELLGGWSPSKVEQLEKSLRRYVIVPYDRELAWAWARLVAACEGAGRPIATSDAWIAAAALRHDVPLLTNNLKHFGAAESLCGLKLL